MIVPSDIQAREGHIDDREMMEIQQQLEKMCGEFLSQAAQEMCGTIPVGPLLLLPPLFFFLGQMGQDPEIHTRSEKRRIGGKSNFSVCIEVAGSRPNRPRPTIEPPQAKKKSTVIP